jgi:hypothetical protein
MRTAVVAAALVLAAACRRDAPPDAAPAIDAPPVGEVTIPAPAAAAGETAEWRRDTVITAKARIYRDGKWRGNVQVVGSRQSRIAVETLAVTGGQPSRLRLRYVGYQSTVSIGGTQRPDGVSFEGKSFEVEVAGDDLRINALGGGGVTAAEVERVGRDVTDLALAWRAVQGRRLRVGEPVAAGTRHGPTLMLEGTQGGAAILRVKLATPLELPVGLEMQATVEGQALIDLGSGRLREVRTEGSGPLETAKVDRRGEMVLTGTAEYVQTDVVSAAGRVEIAKP